MPRWKRFFRSSTTVTHQMDRLGYRLEGPALEHAKGYNIISDGYVPGAIQVPGSGEPIVLFQDAQPPGGYPKIATIISADLARLAQSARARRALRADGHRDRAASASTNSWSGRLATIAEHIAEVPRRGAGARRI